jgi:hypothetical protein
MFIFIQFPGSECGATAFQNMTGFGELPKLPTVDKFNMTGLTTTLDHDIGQWCYICIIAGCLIGVQLMIIIKLYQRRVARMLQGEPGRLNMAI